MAWAVPIREPMRVISEEEYQRAKNSFRLPHSESSPSLNQRPSGVRGLPKAFSESCSIAGYLEETTNFVVTLQVDGEDTMAELLRSGSPSFYSDDTRAGELSRLSPFSSLDSLMPSSPTSLKKGPSSDTLNEAHTFFASSGDIQAGGGKETELTAVTSTTDASVDVTLIFLPDLETLKVVVLVPDFCKDEVILEVSLLPSNKEGKSRRAVSQTTKVSVEETFLFCHVGSSTKQLENSSLRLLFLNASSKQGDDGSGDSFSDEVFTDDRESKMRSNISQTLRRRTLLESEFLRNQNGDDSASSIHFTASHASSNRRRFSTCASKDYSGVHNMVRKISDTLSDRLHVPSPFIQKSPLLLRKGISLLRRKIFAENEAIPEQSSACDFPGRKFSLRSSRDDCVDVQARNRSGCVLGEALHRLEETQWVKTSTSLRHSCSLQLLKNETLTPKSLSSPVPSGQEDLGDLLVSLQHQAKAGRVKVSVVQASCLPAAHFKPEYSVLVRLLNKNGVTAERRTCTLPGESPVWKDSFLFPLTNKLLKRSSFQFVLLRRRLFTSDHVVGHVTIGANQEGEGAQHLQVITCTPEKEISWWHKICPLISD